ncbi:hypothetical protein PCANC_01213 [Puccinia coronata f. sp. avenae]|uniref:Uncharacterized protein n=1 Tax=Puccinia coronata f. sp. avenae TaxID=200324 RepID=A0A2N5W3Q2_9BASI|nr:hypothetical protein PCANC_01213 [Puccinia coronata f. sp. avenae]
MEEKFNKYWSNRQHFSAIALAFDPRSTIENIKDKLYDWFASVSQSATNRLKPGKQKEVEDTNTSAEGADIEARFKRYLASKKTNSALVSPMAELDLYLQEATVAIDSPNFDILTWWKPSHQAAVFSAISEVA